MLRTVICQADYLLQHSYAKGTVELTGAVAHWWALKDEGALSQNSGWIESSGHIAALYKDELFEQKISRAGRARLQNFGVLLGHNRVVIYIEPNASETIEITSNTARTHLLANNESLPWSEWAAEFRNKMPDEIQALMDEVAAGSSSSDHTKAIRERLKQIMNLFKVSRYRLVEADGVPIDSGRAIRGGVPNVKNNPQTGSGGGRSGKQGGTAGGIYSVFLKKDGVPGQRVQADIFPDVRWVSIKDGTREPGDMEDRAARFLLEQNVLQINADFRVFEDMVTMWAAEFGNAASTLSFIEDAVRGWFEQTLVETVIGVQTLKDSKEWSIEDVEAALSEESLTTATMPRYHVNNAIKRELGSKLGKLSA